MCLIYLSCSGTPPPPVILKADTVVLNNNGGYVFVTINPFPKFHQKHDGVFSFTFQYATNSSTNSTLDWRSLGSQNFLPTVNETSSGYIGGTISSAVSY